jgi:hypothetical protein
MASRRRRRAKRNSDGPAIKTAADLLRSNLSGLWANRHVQVIDGPQGRVVTMRPDRHHRQWQPRERRHLREMARQGIRPAIIGLRLGRTEDAVTSQSSKQGTSLRPRPRKRSR